MQCRRCNAHQRCCATMRMSTRLLDGRPTRAKWIGRIGCLSRRPPCGLPHFSPLLQLLIKAIVSTSWPNPRPSLGF
jgi:hypothetical protein